ncbi:hypothetical protein ACH5RR_041623 [Cinchona calisaya]|uniref:Uncharacterized protein n=1 Tax=Cinchona calisaya TaxID=153742 RepID=A0ABD2XU39_9GENT
MGPRKRVGDGKSIRIWEDRWLPNSSTGRVSTEKPIGCEVVLVSQLINGFRWNQELIRSMFNDEDTKSILEIPISLRRYKDTFFWMFSTSGDYTVQSGYNAAKDEMIRNQNIRRGREEISCLNEETRVWRELWKLNTKHKIKTLSGSVYIRFCLQMETYFRELVKGIKGVRCVMEGWNPLNISYFFVKMQ